MVVIKKINNKIKNIIEYMIANPQMPQAKVAEHFGTTYQTIYNYLHSPAVLEYYDERLAQEWEQTIRLAQRQMNALVQRGDRKSCEFVLKTQPAFNPVQRVEADVSNKMITIKVEDDTGNTEQETI